MADKEATKKRDYLHHEPDPFDRFWDRQDTERTAFREIENIEIHLITGEVFKCKLLECGQFVYLVEVKSKKGKATMIVPKHSVNFVVVKDSATE